MVERAALVTRSRRDGALDEALERLAGGQVSQRTGEARSTLDRPDTPDLHVTALRRLPQVPAQFAPFPESLDDRLRTALIARGIAQLYTHQAQSIGHAMAGRKVAVITPTASGKTLCYNAPV